MTFKKIYFGGLLSLMLAACSTTDEREYSSTELLERPPVLASDSRAEPETQVVDESVVSEKETAEERKNGMGDKVYMSDSTPPTLHIKQPIEGAWNTVGQALKQKELKITDFEKDKYLFYVAYDNRGLLDKVGGYFKTTENDPIYVLKLAEDGEETVVTAVLANQSEQVGPDGVNAEDNLEENASDLLQTIYLTMRDELQRIGTKRVRVESSRHSR